MGQYEKYVMGQITYDKNGYATNRIPLWIKPDALLSVENVMGMMRDHFEGTVLDMTKDPGAGPNILPTVGARWDLKLIQFLIAMNELSQHSKPVFHSWHNVVRPCLIQLAAYFGLA